MTLYKWSQTASSDATTDPTINWAEGQAPSSINDSARAMMAELGLDPADLRRGNFIKSFPHQTPVIMNYDAGDYSAALNKALQLADIKGFDARKRHSAQHGKLREILEDAAVEVFDLPASPDLSLDAAYAHDSSLPTDFGLILMNPGKPNRVPEAARQREFCERLGISVLGEIRPPGTSEAGDMVWIDPRTLLIGHGYRTNPAGIAQVRDLLKPHAVEVLTAPLPYGPGPSACLHLMSLISLLDEKTALVDLPWLAVETVIAEHTVRELFPKLLEAGAVGIIEFPLNKII